MLLMRDVLIAKPGQASKLAALMNKMFDQEGMKGPRPRVMVDLVSDYNKVVIESEMEDLRDFEKMMTEVHKPGKKDPKMEKEMAEYHEMFLTGKREIYRIVD